MFHMLSCFNLKEDVTFEEFRDAVEAFHQHMIDASRMVSASPLGRRMSATPMDTDDTRDHQYFFTTTFRSKAECDAAYSYVLKADSDIQAVHRAVMDRVKGDAVFICWEDV